MAKKGKVFEFIGVRFQLDPLIIARRILTRQVPLLATIALIGGVSTIVSYKRAKRIFESRAGIAIRSADFNENRLDKDLNLAANFLASDAEMVLILNELDLYADARRTKPYEKSIQNFRDELVLNTDVGRIEIAYRSENARQAKRVVEFVTERVMSALSQVFEAPFTAEIDVIQRSLQVIEPKLKGAEERLFAFKNKHPRISSELTVLDGVDSPVSAIDIAIRRAEKELAAAKSGKPLPRSQRRGGRNPALKRAKQQLALAKQTYTANHPNVVNLQREVRQLEAKVNSPGGSQANAGGGVTARRAIAVANAKARLKSLLKKRSTEAAKLIQKPKLQQEWQSLSLKVQTLNSEVRELLERRAEVVQNQRLAQSNFYENFQLVDPAMMPKTPVEPKIQKFGGIGMFLTAALGILLALLLEGLRQTIVNSQELEEATGIAVLSSLPAIPERDS